MNCFYSKPNTLVTRIISYITIKYESSVAFKSCFYFPVIFSTAYSIRYYVMFLKFIFNYFLRKTFLNEFKSNAFEIKSQIVGIMEF